MSELSKSQQAYAYIRSRIDDRAFVPGYRLVLGIIASDLGMSVVPVREAIRLLEAEGLVSYERNVGAQVALLNEDEYHHTMETLAVVEGAATAMSAPFVQAEQIARARAINARMRRMLDDFDAHRFTIANREFHSVIYEECPNPHLLDLVHRGWARLRGLRDSSFHYVPERAPESVREHEALLRLIESQASPLQIEMAARDHRTATLDAVLAYQAAHRPHLPTPTRSVLASSASI